MDPVYEANLRLSQFEYHSQHIYLRSWPRCLGLVLGNACNIYCPHCYQPKNGDNLLKPAAIGRELRREFMGFYPYLATLRIQGGEAFAYEGFRELLEDVAGSVRRPLVSVSTNGTLIDEEWAEQIVRLPFSNLTVSIDGGSPETYARLRQGADLDQVLDNVRRIQQWKEKLGSALPVLDSFFVVVRSNFREIPQYLERMHGAGFADIALQTVEISPENLARHPTLERDEVIADAAEIAELHAMMREIVPRGRRHFRRIRTSGLTSLFESRGLDTSFLQEASEGLYPNSDDLSSETALCPNPWTTLFVVENGDVHLCFLSEAVGNLYEMPLAAIWNSPRALTKRSSMIAGRYLASGCSAQWCSWREGQKAEPHPGIATLRGEMRQLADRAAPMEPLVEIGDASSQIGAVRRKLSDRERHIRELEALFAELCQKNAEIHEKGKQYIDSLEARLEESKQRERRSAADYRELQREYQALKDSLAVRIAGKVSRLLPPFPGA